MIQLLKNTFDQLRWWERVLEWYLGRVKLPAQSEALFQSPEQFLLVTQSKSFVFRALLSTFAKRAGLSGIKYFDGIENNVSGTSQPRVLHWVSLDDGTALSRLVALNGRVAGHPPLQLVTLNVFERRGPIRSNPQAQLSIWRHVSLVVLARRLTIVFGKPLPWEQLHSGSTQKLVRSLKVDFYRNLKLVRGTPFQAIEVQARTILHGAEFEREIELIAQRQKTSKAAVRHRAEAEFRAIAANPQRTIFSVVSRLAYFLIRRLFRDILVRGLDSLSDVAKEHTVIIVPMHRSHLDYVLVGAALYQANLNSPVVAAGMNLNFWPFGFFIRGMGGYFVRRNMRQDRIHPLVLKRYVSYLVKRGHLHEFFIEGGRSRSGRMRAPRVGLLSIIMNAYLRGEKKEIVFVPVSITYENVIEDSVFGEENTGRAKRTENLRSLFAARAFLGRRYGEVILHFGEPMPLSRYVASARKTAKGAVDERALLHQVAGDLTGRIRSQTNPSLTSLAYTGLMMAPGYGLPRRELVEIVTGLSQVADIMREQDSNIGQFSPALAAFLGGKTALLDELPRGGIVSREIVTGEEIFYLRGAKRFTADFYRNATIHLFLPTAMLAINEICSGHVLAQDALALHAFFESDFLLRPRAEFVAELETLAAKLQQRGMIGRDQSSGALRFCGRSPGIFMPGILLATIQSYYWVLKNLVVVAGDELNDESCSAGGALGRSVSIKYPEFLASLQEDFKAGVYLRWVSRTEAASQSALEAVLESLQSLGFLLLREHQGKVREVVLQRNLTSELAGFERINRAILAWMGSGSLKREQ